MEKTIEIPFGAKDSELRGWEYTIPENMEAEIKDGKIIVKQKESEDERIRKAIEGTISVYGKTQGEWLCGYDMDTLVIHLREAFGALERQKEQKPKSCDCSRDEESYMNGIHHVLMNPEAYGLIKLKPAKWSEEFLRLMGITISQDGNQVCVLLGENLAEGIAGFGDTLADAVEEFKKEWRQFDRFRKATWKPSEEQMKEYSYWYKNFIESGLASPSSKAVNVLGELLEQLKKL